MYICALHLPTVGMTLKSEILESEDRDGLVGGCWRRTVSWIYPPTGLWPPAPR
jgi:hypothetical protein